MPNFGVKTIERPRRSTILPKAKATQAMHRINPKLRKIPIQIAPSLLVNTLIPKAMQMTSAAAAAATTVAPLPLPEVPPEKMVAGKIIC